jgi:hypothetical protein
MGSNISITKNKKEKNQNISKFYSYEEIGQVHISAWQDMKFFFSEIIFLFNSNSSYCYVNTYVITA